ncbi:MAG: hypothetical protein IJH50_00755 [Kiritimatiellae bacterium]|nr:hypothetical protein [Kiritimatiellia bacterium]
MSMIEALIHLLGVAFAPVTDAHADTIDELYESIINVNQLDHDTVLNWWRALVDYTHGDGPLRVFVRKLERPDPEMSNGRRGFVSCFNNGLSYVYCDNSFARVIYGVTKEPYAPHNGVDFLEAVNLCKLKCLHKTCRGDERATDQAGRRYCVYRHGQSPRGLSGWKVAHIIGVNQFYLGNYNAFQNRNFTRGVLADWTYDDRYGFLVRHSGDMEEPDDRNFFIAHFLRFANPMNYFLIPRCHMVGASGFNKDISEDVRLLEYIRQVRLKEFGEAWNDFERRVLFSGFDVRENSQELGPMQIDFSCRVPAHSGGNGGNVQRAARRSVATKPRRGWDVVVEGEIVARNQSMRMAAFVAVRECAVRHQLDFAGLQCMFPRISGALMTIKRRDEVPAGSVKYSAQSITLRDGVEVVVNTQWCGEGPYANWTSFLEQCNAAYIQIIPTIA